MTCLFGALQTRSHQYKRLGRMLEGPIDGLVVNAMLTVVSQQYDVRRDCSNHWGPRTVDEI